MPEFQITIALRNPNIEILDSEMNEQGNIVLTLKSRSELDYTEGPFALSDTMIERFPALHQVTDHSSLETYLKAIAHDFRNPLSTIIGFADMLDKERHLFSEDRIDKIAQEILRAGEKLNSMLISLSTTSKKQAQ